MILSELLVRTALLVVPTLVAFAISTTKTYLSNHSNVAENVDFISQLPDDILVSILVHIDNTPSAVRTSILSKRWRNIYKFVPSVRLLCDDFLLHGSHVPHGFYSKHIIRKLDEFFSLYSGYKMPSIHLRFCFLCSMNNFESFLFRLGKLGVERLSFLASCDSDKCLSLSFPNLHSSLREFLLGVCILQPKWKGQCNSFLQTLNLLEVELRPGSLECVLLNCLMLDTLEIYKCKSPMKLCFRGPDLQLKTLVLRVCPGLKEVDLHACNLHTLEVLYDLDEINCIFAHVPQLQKFYLGRLTEGLKREKMKMSRVFGKLTKDLPRLKYLILQSCDSNQGCMGVNRTMIGTFRHLKRLDLISIWRCNLASYLESCPLLEELRVAGYHSLHDGTTWREDGAVHSELKKVEISGFEGEEDQIELCLYLLKSAVRLEEMLLCKCTREYITNDKWRMYGCLLWSRETYEMIVRRLQHQAVSPIAQLEIKSYAPP